MPGRISLEFSLKRCAVRDRERKCNKPWGRGNKRGVDLLYLLEPVFKGDEVSPAQCRLRHPPGVAYRF